MVVFIGACCIIGLVGPSDPSTALTALLWVRNRKMPDMMYSRKSPRIALPRNPRTENISQKTATRITVCMMLIARPMTALPCDLRTLRTVAW